MAVKIVHPLPAQSYLRECFDYDPDTGVLRWKVRPPEHFIDSKWAASWNAHWAGQEAGIVLARGYRQVCLDYKKYLAHRIIFRIMTGVDPGELIDHRDTDPGNNRWIISGKAMCVSTSCACFTSKRRSNV